MERNPVKSSQILSVGHDVGNSILEIEFKGGGIYQYFEVPPEIHAGFLDAGSVGKHFGANVKGKFRFAKVEIKKEEE